MRRHENTAGKTESSTFSKLTRWYTDLALISLNSVIFAVIGLLLLAAAIRMLDRDPVYSSHFIPESYELSTAEEIQKIGEEFDEMGEHESYVYNPWTTFTERPFRGELLNIVETESYPTRATISSPRSELKPDQKDLLLWTFGGSTMMGWGVSDKHTVASHLLTELQNALSGYRVRIVNHGHAYYFSSLEVSLYVALLRKDERPDIVVFLDGLNDVRLVGKGIEEPYFLTQAAAGWESERRKRYNPYTVSWFSVNANFPIYRVLRYFQLMNPTAGTAENRTRQPWSDESVKRIVEVINTNRDIASAISKRLGIQAYFFLQPISRHRLDYSIFRPAYAALREAGRSNPEFHDISELLENTLEHPYVDGSHYGDKGTLVVAQRMAQTILRSANLQRP